MTDSAPKREAKCGCCGSVNLEMRKYPVHGCETDCGELADDGTPCRETRPWCSYCGSIGVATPAERPVEEKECWCNVGTVSPGCPRHGGCRRLPGCMTNADGEFHHSACPAFTPPVREDAGGKSCDFGAETFECDDCGFPVVAHRHDKPRPPAPADPDDGFILPVDGIAHVHREGGREFCGDPALCGLCREAK